MSSLCGTCGCNASQAAANAKRLGFEQEFQTGLYTCCQIKNWACEQLSVWTEAEKEDSGRTENSAFVDASEPPALILVRANKPNKKLLPQRNCGDGWWNDAA